MKRRFLVLFIIILSIVPTWAHERASLESILPVLEAYTNEAMAAEGVPGAVIVIVKDNKIIYNKGFGVKVWGQNEPVDEHTPFALASVTKNFTNTLVARLVDQGKLHWKDKVSKYLPGFQLSDPEISQEITIEDLLSHRCGLPGFTGDSLIDLGWHALEIFPKLNLFPFKEELRKTYTYQNVIVGIMGRIIEKVTDKPLSHVYQKELFELVGLTETQMGAKQPANWWQKILNLWPNKKSTPTFHDTFQGKTRFLPAGNPGIYTFPASSGIVSTAQDLGKWLIFQLNNTQINGKPLVSKPNVEKMRTPHIDVPVQGGRQFPKSRITKVHYGLGWFIHDYAGIPVFSHMGGMAGTRTIMVIIPQDNIGIAVLTNLGGMRVSLFPEAIRNKFLDLYLKVKDEKDWAKELRDDMRQSREKYEKQRRLEMIKHPAPHRPLDDYAGIYENSLYGQLEIALKEKSLILMYRDRPHVHLTHWNGDVFEFNGTDLSHGFSGVDIGEVIFSSHHGKSNQMIVSLLHEGINPIFERVR